MYAPATKASAQRNGLQQVWINLRDSPNIIASQNVEKSEAARWRLPGARMSKPLACMDNVLLNLLSVPSESTPDGFESSLLTAILAVPTTAVP